MLAPYMDTPHSDEEWATLVKVTESATNHKPLVELLADPAQEVVTPHKLSEAHDKSISEWGLSKEWRRRWKHLSTVSNKNTLQSTLRERRSAQKGAKVKVGQKVLIEGQNEKRVNWKKGKIKELVPSHDGKNKVVVVETTGGKQVRRAVKHLLLLGG